MNLNHVADMINKQRSASMNDFEISHDKGSDTWHVIGSGITRFVQMTNWQYVFSSPLHRKSIFCHCFSSSAFS